MIDLWFRQDLKSILDTKSVAVFVDESGEAEFLLRAVGNDFTIHRSVCEIDELHIKYLIEIDNNLHSGSSLSTPLLPKIISNLFGNIAKPMDYLKFAAKNNER